MTRLTSDDIEGISGHLIEYDRDLASVTGLTLLGIGAVASGLEDCSLLRHVAPTIKMAVVPVRSGLGVIPGFAETVCSILVHLGFAATVTAHPDVAGFDDALHRGAQVIFASDDNRFVAFCPRQGQTVDNSRATANGFIAGLNLMAGGLAGKGVLVLGCGPVGRGVVEALLMRKARVYVVDRDIEKALGVVELMQAERQTTIQVSADLELALSTHDFIVDATNTANVIHPRHVTASTCIAAPGLPCGATPAARKKLSGRILHDPLQIGVAVMACEAMRIIHVKSASVQTTALDGEGV